MLFLRREFERHRSQCPRATHDRGATGQNHEIWVMEANGENPHRIVTGENDTYAAVAWLWSPNAIM
jgi:hypothetical protein